MTVRIPALTKRRGLKGKQFPIFDKDENAPDLILPPRKPKKRLNLPVFNRQKLPKQPQYRPHYNAYSCSSARFYHLQEDNAIFRVCISALQEYNTMFVGTNAGLCPSQQTNMNYDQEKSHLSSGRSRNRHICR